jgi:hypothetical protein
MPYLVAAVAASAVMAWYFFVFVPSKLDYFIGLRFRTLAVASGQMASKADNLLRSLRSLQQATGVHDKDRYLSILLPELQTGSREGTPGLTLDAHVLRATAPWEDVLRSAAGLSANDFDDLILAKSDGSVLWQRERTTPRIGKLGELLNADPEPTGWFSSLSWQVHTTTLKAPKDLTLPATALLKPVNLNGVPSYLFMQSVQLLPEIAPGDHEVYLGGIVSNRTLQDQAMTIPIVWIVMFALPVALLFLALPFIKLATLTPKERYGFTDVILMALAIVSLIGIGAILPFSAGARPANDQELTSLADSIERNFATETGKILNLARSIQASEIDITHHLKNCLTTAQAGAKDHRCGLWEALSELQPKVDFHSPADNAVTPGSLELDVVAWVDLAGDQKQKWTTKQEVTAYASHRPFQHFRDLKAQRTWKLPEESTSFTIEPLRTPTTAEMGFIFGLPATAQNGHADQFLVLNVRPESVVDPVLPPHYGFAVLAEDGRVLFHSTEGLSLEENFFNEVSDPEAVRARLRSGHGTIWTGDYHGRPHRLLLRPLSTFISCPWRIVTFQELGPSLDSAINQQAAILRLGTLNLVFLATLVLAYWGFLRVRSRRLHDVLAGFRCAGVTSLLLMALFGAGVISFFATYRANMSRHLDGLYLVFAALPVLTVMALRVPGKKHSVFSMFSLGPKTKAATVVTLVALLPALGLIRIVYRLELMNDAEHSLELIDQASIDRRARVMDRVNGTAYSSETRELLTSEGGFASHWLSNRSTVPLFSYLSINDSEGLGPRSMEGATTEDLLIGQKHIRSLLAWWPGGAMDSPRKPEVKVTSDGTELRLRSSVEHVPIVLAGNIAGAITQAPSGWRLWLGVVIVLTVYGGLFWAYAKLDTPRHAAAPDLDKQLAALSTKGGDGVLVIGPPRTRKDELVRREIEKVAGRPAAVSIRLLDVKLTQGYIDRTIYDTYRIIEQRGQNARDVFGRVWIHVSNLETQLVSVESRAHVLRLLERLLKEDEHRISKTVVVTTSVDPVATFEEVFDQERQCVYIDALPEVELSRSSLTFSRLSRCYVPIRLRNSGRLWRSWLTYNPVKWRDTLSLEADGYEPLQRIAQELKDGPWKSTRRVSLEELSRVFTARAQASYELLWNSCTRSEKLVLVQLAQEGLVNPKNLTVASALMAKGLVVDRPRPRIFNYTFRAFLQRIERRQVVNEWEQGQGNGLWVTAGRLIGSSMVAGGLFFMITQGLSVQSLLPVVSGTGVFGIPVVRDVIARATGKSDKSSVAT